MNSEEKNKYMLMAIELARKADEMTYPNPMVGAIIVKDNKVIAEGYHRKAGEDHAEIVAIKNAGSLCKGSTMFVTLEPCDTYGRTPPCTKSIIESGIKKVVIAMTDPNPINGKKGISRLISAGISVETGVCEDDAKYLNRKYIKYISKELPYITVKIAQSVDGKIAARDGSSKWISSPKSREYVKTIRDKYDAIVVGINTAISDNPYLLGKQVNGCNATRIVIDSKLRLSLKANLVTTAVNVPLIIATTELADFEKIKRFKKIKGVEVIVTRSKESQVSLKTFFQKMALRGMVNVLVEGGGTLVGSLFDSGMVDEVIIFIAPILIGGNFSSIKGKGMSNIEQALKLKNVSISDLGGDIFFRGVIDKG